MNENNIIKAPFNKIDKSNIKSNEKKNSNLNKLHKVKIKINKIDPVQMQQNTLDKFKLSGIQNQLKAALSKQIANNDLPESMKSIIKQSKRRTDVNFKSSSVKESLIESPVLVNSQSSHSEINVKELGKLNHLSNNIVVDNRQQNTKKVLSDFLLRKKINQNIIDTPVLNSEKIISSDMKNTKYPKRLPKNQKPNHKEKIVSTVSVSYPAIAIAEKTININIKPIASVTDINKKSATIARNRDVIVEDCRLISPNRSKKLFEGLNEVNKEVLQFDLDKVFISPNRQLDNITMNVAEEQSPMKININFKNNSSKLQPVDNETIMKPVSCKSVDEIESTRQITKASDLPNQSLELEESNHLISTVDISSLPLPSFHNVFILPDKKIENLVEVPLQKEFNILPKQNKCNYNSNKSSNVGNQLHSKQMHNSGQNISPFKPYILLKSTKELLESVPLNDQKKQYFSKNEVRTSVKQKEEQESNLLSNFNYTKNTQDIICKDQNINTPPDKSEAIDHVFKVLDNIIAETTFGNDGTTSGNGVGNESLDNLNIASCSQQNDLESAVDFLANLDDVPHSDNNDDTEDIISINSDEISNDSESFADFINKITNVKKEGKSPSMSLKSEPISPVSFKDLTSSFTILENKVLTEDEQYKIYPNFETLKTSNTEVVETVFAKEDASVLSSDQQALLGSMPRIVIVPSAEQIENNYVESNSSLNEIIAFNAEEYIINDFPETQLSNASSMSDQNRLDKSNCNNSSQLNNMEHVEEVNCKYQNLDKLIPEKNSTCKLVDTSVKLFSLSSSNSQIEHVVNDFEQIDIREIHPAGSCTINSIGLLKKKNTSKTEKALEPEEEILAIDKIVEFDETNESIIMKKNKAQKSSKSEKANTIKNYFVIEKNTNKKIKIPATSTPVKLTNISLFEESVENNSQQETSKERNVNCSELVECKNEFNKSEIIEVTLVNDSELNSIDYNKNDNIHIEESSFYSIPSIEDSYDNDEPLEGFKENLVEELPESNMLNFVHTCDHTYTNEKFIRESNAESDTDTQKLSIDPEQSNEFTAEENVKIENTEQMSSECSTQKDKNKIIQTVGDSLHIDKSEATCSTLPVSNKKLTANFSKLSKKEFSHSKKDSGKTKIKSKKKLIKKSKISNEPAKDSLEDSNESNYFLNLRKGKKRSCRLLSSDDDENINIPIKIIEDSESNSTGNFKDNSNDDSNQTNKIMKSEIEPDNEFSKAAKTTTDEEPIPKRGRFSQKLHPNLLLITKRCELDQVDLVKFDSNKKLKKTECQCGMCKKTVNKKLWNAHLHSHYGIGWKEGEEPLDLTSRALVLNKLINYFKLRDCKPLVCRICNGQYKSGLGILDHLTICGLPVEQRRVQCEHCQRSFAPTSISNHLRRCVQLIMKMNQIEVDRIDTETKQVEEELFTNSGRSKRKSKIKAESNIKFVTRNFFNEQKFDPNEFIKSMNQLSGGFYKKFKTIFDAAETAKCPGCSTDFKNYDSFRNHTKKCNKIKFSDYQCKVCNKIFSHQKLDEAVQHVIDTHKGNTTSKAKLKPNLSDSECEINMEDEVLESESEDEGSLNTDENELSAEEETIISDIDSIDEQNSKKRKICIKPILSSGAVSKHLNLIGGDKLFFFDLIKITKKWMNDFQIHHFSEHKLYDYAIPDYKTIQLDCLLSYLPENKISMKFSFGKEKINTKVGTTKPTKPWMNMKQFHTLNLNNEIFLYIGGPITTLNWIPVQQIQNKQYLVISYKINFNQFIRRINSKSFKSLILIHKLESKIFNKSNAENSSYNNIHYGIVHNTSPINDIKFLPSGGYNENINRLGLMAVADNKSIVNIYSLPIKAPKNCDNYNEINILQLNCKIQLKLTLFDDDSDSKNDDVKLFDNYTNVQCTKIVWSKSKNHNYLLTGYSNGFVAIWDISKSNILTNNEVNDVQISTPINYFMVTDKSIIGLDIHYDESDNPKWFIATSTSRAIKVYDIENFMQPVCIMEEMARSFPTDCTWPLTWENPCVSISNDLYQSSVSAYNPLGIFHKQHRYCRSWDSIKTIDFNPWINLMAAGCDNGDIFIEVNGEMNQDVSLKRYFDKKFFSYTDLISLDGNNIPILKEETPKKNSQPAKKSKEWNELVQDGIKLFDNDYEKKYGIIFGELSYMNFDRKINSIDDRIPPFNLNCFVRINAITWNENENSNNLCAIGYENGFIRIINFDVMRFKHEGKIL